MISLNILYAVGTAIFGLTTLLLLCFGRKKYRATSAAELYQACIAGQVSYIASLQQAEHDRQDQVLRAHEIEDMLHLKFPEIFTAWLATIESTVIRTGPPAPYTRIVFTRLDGTGSPIPFQIYGRRSACSEVTLRELAAFLSQESVKIRQGLK